MTEYSYKVVAVLKDSLGNEKAQEIQAEICDLKSKLHIQNLDAITYIKKQPYEKYQDFGAVAFFFCALKDKLDCFSKLEYYDLLDAKIKIAV